MDYFLPRIDPIKECVLVIVACQEIFQILELNAIGPDNFTYHIV